MSGEEILESMDNSWKALNRIYSTRPDDSIRMAANIVARIIGEVKSEAENFHQKEDKTNREGQITIEEWIAFLNGEG